jgi:hypothetical protein
MTRLPCRSASDGNARRGQVLRADGTPAKWQVRGSLAEPLLAGQRTAQFGLHRIGGGLDSDAVRCTMESAKFRFTKRSAECFGEASVVVHGGFISWGLAS